MTFTIYALMDTRNSDIFYIGASGNPRDRIHQHKQQAKWEGGKAKNATQLYIRDVLTTGGDVQMMFIERVSTVEQAEEREAFWISCYYLAGYPLTNVQKVEREFDANPHKSIVDNPPILYLTDWQLESLIQFKYDTYRHISGDVQRLLIQKGVIGLRRGRWGREVFITALGIQLLNRYQSVYEGFLKSPTP